MKCIFTSISDASYSFIVSFTSIPVGPCSCFCIYIYVFLLSFFFSWPWKTFWWSHVGLLLCSSCFLCITTVCHCIFHIVPFSNCKLSCSLFFLRISSQETLSSSSLSLMKSAFLNSIVLILLLSFLPFFRFVNSIVL